MPGVKGGDVTLRRSLGVHDYLGQVWRAYDVPGGAARGGSADVIEESAKCLMQRRPSARLGVGS